MDILQPYFILLCASLIMMLVQLLAKNKDISHILFAMFCGSIAVMAAQKLNQDSLGSYYYLVGMGACFTCNGYWLLARSLFRRHHPIALRHIVLAATVSIMLFIHLGLKTTTEFELLNSSGLIPLNSLFSEILVFLSSTMSLLTFWEAYRGYASLNQNEKHDRRLFMGMYCGVILLGSMMPSVFPHANENGLFVTIAALIVLALTQYLLVRKRSYQTPTDPFVTATENTQNIEKLPAPKDDALANRVQELLHKQKVYLTPNLKVVDMAAQLQVSEYRVSQVLRTHFNADNFNQFINTLRIEHAKSLLATQDNDHWPVLVIGLESGFASIGPFNRAFKAATGDTPNQYRKRKTAEGKRGQCQLIN